MEKEKNSTLMLSCVITPLPTPPTSREPSSFDERADEFLESLPRFGEELNDFRDGVNEFYEAFFPKAKLEGEAIVQDCAKEGKKVAEQIKQIKEDAKKEIADIIVVSSGRLKESVMSTYLLALSVREIVIRNRRNYERIGEVKEFVAKGVPRGYVKLPASLSVVEYPLLYHALRTRSTKGVFEVYGKEGQIIYTGKGD